MIDDGQMVDLMQEVKKRGGMVTVHATNGDMIDKLIARHRAEGKLSPLYHYLSQPEVTESGSLGAFLRYGQLHGRSRLHRAHDLRRRPECRAPRHDPQPENFCRNLHSIPYFRRLALPENRKARNG